MAPVTKKISGKICSNRPWGSAGGNWSMTSLISLTVFTIDQGRFASCLSLSRSFGDLHQLRGPLVNVLEIIQHVKGAFELLEIVIRPQGADACAFRVGFLHSSCRRERQCRNCMGVNMSVGLLSNTNSKIGGLLDLA